VYTLVRGLFNVLSPTLLNRAANNNYLSEAQAAHVIFLMESYFRKVLEMAKSGLISGDEAIQFMIEKWSSEIFQCTNN
jgi:hypothetical protein